MLSVMPSEDRRLDRDHSAQVIDLRSRSVQTDVRNDNARIRNLALECLFCGTQHGDERAVADCEEGHYWDVVAGLAQRERTQHLRDALGAARRRGHLSPACVLLLGRLVTCDPLMAATAR